MAKHNLTPNFSFEPDYDMADAEPDDAAQAEYEAGTDVDYDPPAYPEYEDAVQADYEQPADPEYDDAGAEPAALPLAAAPARVLAAAPGFAFELGRPVLPLTQERPHLVVWRGHLKERHPATGLVHRVPVYRLADGHWDCYREEELQVAEAARPRPGEAEPFAQARQRTPDQDKARFKQLLLAPGTPPLSSRRKAPWAGIKV